MSLQEASCIQLHPLKLKLLESYVIPVCVYDFLVVIFSGFIYLFVCLFICCCLLVCLLVCSLEHSIDRSFIHSFVRSFVHSHRRIQDFVSGSAFHGDGAARGWGKGRRGTEPG